ncbi:hypothetical protein [Citreicella sp. C3M06]|uniref:hypothetical protein n=1 Tax=Citreicella sp. C3M06 TaxID=2841564 RepID=UPI001C0A0A21|nr:hypothetical protein [Citreicella sp. C3M06]
MTESMRRNWGTAWPLTVSQKSERPDELEKMRNIKSLLADVHLWLCRLLDMQLEQFPQGNFTRFKRFQSV